MNQTPLSREVLRVVESTVNEKGDPLIIVLFPDGTLSLRWKGGRESEAKKLKLSDLMSGVSDGGEPKEWGEWVRSEDISAQVAIDPELDFEERGHLLRILEKLKLHRKWMSTPNRPSWEEFVSGLKKEHVLEEGKAPRKRKKQASQEEASNEG